MKKEADKTKKNKKQNWILESEEETDGKFNQSNRFRLK